jgi:membrane protein
LFLVDAALDAVLVEGEELEVLALGEPDAGLGEGDVDLGVAGGAVGGLADADGVDGAFDGDAAVEGPAVGGDGLDEVGFQAADGGQGLVDAGAVFAVGDLVVGGQDVDLAGEAVAVGVEGARVAVLGVKAVRDVFPGNSGGVVVQNLQPWMVPHLHWTSMFLLLVTSNGIFEPLEVALNRTWGVTQNRSYWKNQVVSLGMVFACGALMLLSLMLSALSAEWAASWLGNGTLAAWLTMLLTKLAAVPLTILGLFLIYWLLPNRKIDPARVAPVAIWVGLVLEGLKYVNMLTRSLIAQKLDKEYHMFQYSVTILLGSFVAAMIVLAGAEWTARRDRVDPLAKE